MNRKRTIHMKNNARFKYWHHTMTLLLLAAGWISTGCGGGSGGTGGAGGGVTTIQNKGSDTMVNLAQAWAEEYKKVNPDVDVEVSGGGSGVGIAALIRGTIDIANASRDMKPEEIEAAKKNTGKEPKEIIVGLRRAGHLRPQGQPPRGDHRRTARADLRRGRHDHQMVAAGRPDSGRQR